MIDEKKSQTALIFVGGGLLEGARIEALVDDHQMSTAYDSSLKHV